MATIEAGTRVFGDAGVFYADKSATGTVLNRMQDGLLNVRLDDGERATVPVLSVKPIDSDN